MAPGISALNQVQIGQETTAGTKVTPTTLWRGMGMIKDNTEIEFLDENIGIAGGALRSRIPATGGEIPLAGGFTFEQGGYVFQSGFYSTSPTTDTSSAKIWTWTVQTGSTDPIETTDLKTLTIRAGDNQQAEFMSYCFTREFTLSGRVGEGLDITATMEGRAVGTTDFETGLAIPTVEDVLFTNGLLYLDATTDIGTTQVSQTLFSVDLTITTGWKGYKAADGRTDFSFAKWTGSDIMLNVTFEHNSTAVTEKANWRNETERALRLQFNGSALSTTDAAATYDKKALVVDLWGKWESFDAISDEDGNNHVTGTFHAGYSSTGANKARFIIVNELASLP